MEEDTVYNLFSVTGKRALVTSGSAGLGRAVAETLGDGGAMGRASDSRRQGG